MQNRRKGTAADRIPECGMRPYAGSVGETGYSSLPALKVSGAVGVTYGGQVNTRASTNMARKLPGHTLRPMAQSSQVLLGRRTGR